MTAMAEYIEREAALAEADYDGNFNLVIPAKKVRNIPAADVAPVVHGRWVEKEKYTFGIIYDCSLCENRILDNGHSWNYCPNCGARMDLEET